MFLYEVSICQTLDNIGQYCLILDNICIVLGHFIVIFLFLFVMYFCPLGHIFAFRVNFINIFEIYEFSISQTVLIFCNI